MLYLPVLNSSISISISISTPLPMDSQSDESGDLLDICTLPVIDLRSLCQDEIYRVAEFCRNPKERIKNHIATLPIDRSMFNESVGSRRQTYARTKGSRRVERHSYLDRASRRSSQNMQNGQAPTKVMGYMKEKRAYRHNEALINRLCIQMHRERGFMLCNGEGHAGVSGTEQPCWSMVEYKKPVEDLSILSLKSEDVKAAPNFGINSAEDVMGDENHLYQARMSNGSHSPIVRASQLHFGAQENSSGTLNLLTPNEEDRTEVWTDNTCGISDVQIKPSKRMRTKEGARQKTSMDSADVALLTLRGFEDICHQGLIKESFSEGLSDEDKQTEQNRLSEAVSRDSGELNMVCKVNRECTSTDSQKHIRVSSTASDSLCGVPMSSALGTSMETVDTDAKAVIDQNILQEKGKDPLFANGRCSRALYEVIEKPSLGSFLHGTMVGKQLSTEYNDVHGKMNLSITECHPNSSILLDKQGDTTSPKVDTISDFSNSKDLINSDKKVMQIPKEANTPPANDEIEFKCKSCEKVFDSSRKLLGHSKCHSNIYAVRKEFECDLCGKVFDRYRRYLGHRHIHSRKRNKSFAVVVEEKKKLNAVVDNLDAQHKACQYCGKISTPRFDSSIIHTRKEKVTRGSELRKKHKRNRLGDDQRNRLRKDFEKGFCCKQCFDAFTKLLIPLELGKSSGKDRLKACSKKTGLLDYNRHCMLNSFDMPSDKMLALHSSVFWRLLINTSMTNLKKEACSKGTSPIFQIQRKVPIENVASKWRTTSIHSYVFNSLSDAMSDTPPLEPLNSWSKRGDDNDRPPESSVASVQDMLLTGWSSRGCFICSRHFDELLVCCNWCEVEFHHSCLIRSSPAIHCAWVCPSCNNSSG